MNAEIADQTRAVKVLIVDDEAFIRRGMNLYLSGEGYRVIEATNEEGAWHIVQNGTQEHPAVDVAIIDISIPPDAVTPSRTAFNYGIRLVGRIKQIYPTIAVVLYTAYEDRGTEILEMLNKGVRGLAYKLKGCAPSDFLTAIELARAGHVLIDPEVSNPSTLETELTAQLTDEERPWVMQAQTQFDNLSKREVEVVSRLAASQSIEHIATELCIAPKTVDNYIGSVYEKLGLNDAPAMLRRQTLLAKACMIHELHECQR
jgi:DNA-binding NarL/FixJ family response regulator